MSLEHHQPTEAAVPAASPTPPRVELSTGQALGLWAAVTVPMIALAWGVAPWVIARVPLPAVATYWLVLLVGLAWQSGVALWVIERQEGDLRWRTVRRRLWLNAPRDRRTGRRTARAWWRLLVDGPVIGLTVVVGILMPVWLLLVARFSFDVYAWPGSRWPAYANLSEFASPEFAGQDWIVVVGMLVWFFAALCSEELFFRGVLLPGTTTAWGRRNGLANALLYALYGAFQYWLIPVRLIMGLMIAGTARRYASNQTAIALRSVEGLVVLAVLLIGVNTQPLTAAPLPAQAPYVSQRPTPLVLYRGTLTSLPTYDGASGEPYQVDLRGADLSDLDLRDADEALAFADFDLHTVWPAQPNLPQGFDAAQVMRLGKDPGLGVRALHARGITGQGVGVAIIDQPLLTEHVEYADRLLWYEELPGGFDDTQAAMHGPAVASIAVGKTVGVAPGAELYYIGGAGSSLFSIPLYSHDYAQAIRRILQINTQLPLERQIRVISMSTGMVDAEWIAGYDDYRQAVREAEVAGLLVLNVNTGTGLPADVTVLGSGRAPLADANDFAAVEPGLFLADGFFAENYPGTLLFAPMDSRTVAAPGGAEDYAFGRIGGLSWVAPYFAGLYALAAQVDPVLTPQRFWALAVSTGRTTTITHARQTYSFGVIVDPIALIAAIEK